VFVNVLEKVSREFPALLEERKLFLEALSFLNVLNGTMRAAVLKCLDRYMAVCKSKQNIEDIEDVARSTLGI